MDKPKFSISILVEILTPPPKKIYEKSCLSLLSKLTETCILSKYQEGESFELFSFQLRVTSDLKCIIFIEQQYMCSWLSLKTLMIISFIWNKHPTFQSLYVPNIIKKLKQFFLHLSHDSLHPSFIISFCWIRKSIAWPALELKLDFEEEDTS